MKGDIAAFASCVRKTYADTLHTNPKYGGPISYIKEEAEKNSTREQPNRARIAEDFDR